MMWVRRGYFIWCSCWWGTESPKPWFYSDSQNRMVAHADFQPTKPSIHYESEHPSHVRVMSSYSALHFLKHCPDINYQKLCQPLSACIHTLVCLRVCLRVAEGVRNLANCCIIFGTLAPSLQRASLKSVGSLHPIPPPCSDSGSQAKSGSAGLTGCSQSSSTKTCWTCGPYTAQHPQQHTTLPTDGWTTYRKPSSSVFSECFRGFHPPLESSGQTLPRVSMFLFVQQSHSHVVVPGWR